MISFLGSIQETVTKYAWIISKVLNVDVEIMDEEYIRIAGTGEYKKQTNNSMIYESKVYESVLLGGETKIIENPGKEALCDTCGKKNSCLELFEICTPIKLKNKVIGVIGLICFHEEQRSNIIGNIKLYVEFLEQIADLISAKVFEEREKIDIIKRSNILNTIVEKYDKGVIILNKNNHITHINKSALEILKIEDPINKKISIISTGNYYIDQPEYKMSIDKIDFLLIGNIINTDLEDEKYYLMFIFDEVRTIKNWIGKISETENNISLANILSTSDKIEELKVRAKQINKSTSTVLITGESGTGKELFARAIHKTSTRSNNSFIAINCGAIPESLLESELFGYTKGAFTGADPKGKVGKFELANKGTIFLDEIGDMPLYMQVKLLRVIQDREITRIGSNEIIKSDVRIIAATNRNLEELIKEGRFREDLYYRLNVIPFEIPPLRERKEDIKILSIYFAKKYSDLFNKRFVAFDKEVWKLLYKYEWYGNVRELENVIEYLINIMDESGTIIKENLPKNLINEKKESADFKIEDDVISLKDMEKQLIKNALKVYGNSTEGKKAAANKLGIGIATLYRKIEEYGFI